MTTLQQIPRESIVERLHEEVARREDLAGLLEQQARRMPSRVFGMADLSGGELFDRYVGEANHFLDLARPYLRPGARVLEIGGGLGIFLILAFLEGTDIVAIEPSESTGGFSLFREVGTRLVDAFIGQPERFVDARAEALPWPDDTFDLVLSNNVLEHLEDPRRALHEMYRVTRPGGRLMHHCPNYLVPYEPHYKVPIIPGAVRLSGRLLWRSFQRDPLWQSLNDISALTVWRAAKALPGAQLAFCGVMQQTLERLQSNPHFAHRHQRWGRLVLSPPVRRLLSVCPPALMSPMMFTIKKES